MTRIEAIKLFRISTGASLKLSKDVFDRLEKDLKFDAKDYPNFTCLIVVLLATLLVNGSSIKDVMDLLEHSHEFLAEARWAILKTLVIFAMER